MNVLNDLTIRIRLVYISPAMDSSGFIPDKE
jgi:hypothetical protein